MFAYCTSAGRRPLDELVGVEWCVGGCHIDDIPLAGKQDGAAVCDTMGRHDDVDVTDDIPCACGV